LHLKSVHHYVADLRCLASLCKFGRLEEEMIRDQLAEHTINPKLREKLFMSPDDLSLVKAVELAFQLESAALLTSRLTAPDAAPSHSAQLAQMVTPATRSPSPALAHDELEPFKWCTVEVDGVCLPLLLDTAASRSLLSESTVRRLFPRQLIKAGAEELYGYGHTRIGMVGTCTFSVRYGSRFLPAFTFQVSRHGANLLGFDLFCALGFSITDNTGTAILTVTTPWQQRWPSLFTGLGCLTAFNHQPLIDSTVSPVIQPLRRLPLSLHDDVTAELQKLLDAGIIERVDASPWISNLVVAKKKSDGLCPCVDLRQANKGVIPDKYPLPTMEELSAKFHGSTVFSKLDLHQGYLQVPLHPDSRNLTAFVSHMGVFRYTRMPFGLSSAPSCFQKIMATIFAGIPGVVVYLDDIVVHRGTATIHDQRLSRVLDVLAHHSLTLNGEKGEVPLVHLRPEPTPLKRRRHPAPA
ncbi:hypothetical protein L3Q82_010785, partial [Scortum barcoo]